MALVLAHKLKLQTTPAPAGPLTFMLVPAEIRLKVYEYVFAQIKIFELCPGHEGGGGPVYRFEPSHPLALLIACKKIKNEAQQLAKQCPIAFVVKHLSITEAPCFPPPVLEQFTSVSLPEARFILPEILMQFDEELYPRLKRLEVSGRPQGLGGLKLVLPFKIAVELVGTQIPGVADSEMLKQELIEEYWEEDFDEIERILKSRNLTLQMNCGISVFHIKTKGCTAIMNSAFPAWEPDGPFHRIVAQAVLVWDKSGVKLVKLRELPTKGNKRAREYDDDSEGDGLRRERRYHEGEEDEVIDLDDTSQGEDEEEEEDDDESDWDDDDDSDWDDDGELPRDLADFIV